MDQLQRPKAMVRGDRQLQLEGLRAVLSRNEWPTYVTERRGIVSFHRKLDARTAIPSLDDGCSGDLLAEDGGLNRTINGRGSIQQEVQDYRLVAR
jgi:hypothetical protein